MADTSSDSSSFIELTANIVSAYVSNNTVPSADVPNLISQVHAALKRVSGGQAAAPAEPLKPAVPIKRDQPALSQALLAYVVAVMAERLSFANRVVGVLQR